MWPGEKPPFSLVLDPEKIEAVQALVKGSQEDQFGPLTGEEDSGAFDDMLLREALETMTINDGVRAKIHEILSGWNEGR